jgi:catechol 2,3-dioxygenase-like lactoylglutathione lyase family enzyme
LVRAGDSGPRRGRDNSRTPEGVGEPKAIIPKPEITPANTLGLHRVMFAVNDIEDTLARLRPHGAELVGEVTRYEDLPIRQRIGAARRICPGST